MFSDDMFIKANHAYEKEEFTNAFKLFLQCAKNGDTPSMERVANMYTCGEGVKYDYSKAIEWELKAIKAGSIDQ